MRILAIIPYAPTLIRVRPYNLLRSLARHGNRVKLFTLYESQDELDAVLALRDDCIEVYAFPLTRSQTVWNTLATFPGNRPLQSAYCRQPALARALRSAVAAGDCDVIHIEHLRGSRYGLWLKSQFPDLTTPIIWDSVDCITYLFEQAAQHSLSLSSRLMTRFELRRTRHYERYLTSQFNRILVTSIVDKVELDRISERPASRVKVLPNGVALDYFKPRTSKPDTNTVIFTGKMSYHANASAALFLAQQIMPLVWALRPSARLVIAGSRPTAQLQRLAADNRISVTGYMPDLRLPLSNATLSVAPLLYGAGIQNKVLEAMACGTPVVATRQAVAALKVTPGQDCLVADAPQGIAEAILRLLNDAELRAQLSDAGRRYVEQYHNWDMITATLESIYSEEIESLPACLTGKSN